MEQEIKEIKDQLKQYQELQKKWQQQRQFYIKNISILQQEIIQTKALNATLLKKTKHKRTSSQQHTFIFNQTNISSYYPMVLLQSNWNIKVHLRAHLDSVRSLWWHGKYLISGGWDYVLKVWEKDQIKSTVRQHLGPIYSICGNNNDYIYSGGGQGVLRRWNFEKLLNGQSPQNELQLHNDSIWQLSLNSINDFLLTSSSDGTCKLLKTNTSKLKQLKCYQLKNDIPTSVDWIGQDKFITGCVYETKMIVFDLEKGISCRQYNYQAKQKYNQANKVVFSQRHKIIVSGHQDKNLRFFDTNSNKLLKSMVAHSDSITSLCVKPDSYELVTCGNDGNMRIWDLRKYRCVHDISVNMRKYDQAALCIAHKKDEPLIAVGGADGHIKIVTPQH